MPRYRILVVTTVLLLALGADAGQGQPAAKDWHGDPLPSGAVGRLPREPGGMGWRVREAC